MMKDSAKKIKDYVSGEIVSSFYDKLSSDPDFYLLAHHLRQLENRSREYENPSFVVLVVGPVKSGKSTFVNLVAKDYVSPTHFLECTVRPSLISKGDKPSLTVYRTTNTDNKEAQMNGILDCLNGLIGDDEVPEVKRTEYELCPETIDAYVKLDMVNVNADATLLTSIKTKGGKLLQDNVFLVDMAGFDGHEVHLDSPAYKAIVERADLIIFVQSSNSAISKVSSSFFKLLEDKNRSVPVCLVHNVFEAGYWRSDEQNAKDIEVQRKHAIMKIKDTYGLLLDDENSFNLNLGKVTDYRAVQKEYKPEFEDALEKANEQFEQAETKMYELFSRREGIRVKNCIVRTKTQQERLLEEIEKVKEQFQARLAEYDMVSENFKSLVKESLPVKLLAETGMSLQHMQSLVEQAYLRAKMGVISTQRYRTDDTQKIVYDFIADIEAQVKNCVSAQGRNIHAEIWNRDDVQAWMAEIIAMSAKYGMKVMPPSVSGSVADLNITFKDDVNVTSLVPHQSLWHRHDHDMIVGYLQYVYAKINGFVDTGRAVSGSLENRVYPQIQEHFESLISKGSEAVVREFNALIEKTKSEVLSGMISDIEAYRAKVEMIEAFEEKVNKLEIHIYN